MKKLSLLLSIIALSQIAIAQTRTCATGQIHQEYYSQNPAAIAEQQRINREFKEYLKTKDLNSLKANQTAFAKSKPIKYIIPVVFHILHDNGPELYSDLQVQQEIDNMNACYQGRNPFRHLIRDIFKDVEGDAQIEFRLAKKDPQGRCTNGIEHHYVGPMVNKSNDIQKLNTWDPQHYVNIWTTRRIQSGANFAVGGYAYLPTGAPNSKSEGIIISNKIGVKPFDANTPFEILTGAHEAGHYLGLEHPFSNSSTDSCGDGDGIFDTPPAYYIPTTEDNKNHNACGLNPPYNSCATDNPDLPDQYENIMDYFTGPCAGTMFTLGQVARIHFTLDTYRTELHTKANLIATGIDVDTVIIKCPPVSSFSIFGNSSLSGNVTCVGNSVIFRDNSYNGEVTERLWNFGPDAVPQTSTAQNVVVKFNTPGSKTISLYTKNAAGDNTTTIPGFVMVHDAVSGGVTHGAQYADWDYQNNFLDQGWYYEYEYPNQGWQRVTNAKYDGVASLKLGAAGTNSTPPLINQFNYSLISPGYDLSGSTKPWFHFWYSYAPNFVSYPDLPNIDSQDKLTVSVSTDCGKTWVEKFARGGNPENPRETASNPLRHIDSSDGPLITTPLTSAIDFVPTNRSQWAQIRVEDSSEIPALTNVKFKITYHYARGNNLYLDKLEFGLRTATDEITAADLRFSLHPNPFSGTASILYNLPQSALVDVKLIDLLGRDMGTIFSGRQSQGNQSIQIDRYNPALKDGIYFIKLRTGNTEVVRKIVVNQD